MIILQRHSGIVNEDDTCRMTLIKIANTLKMIFPQRHSGINEDDTCQMALIK
jgi:hypothetical protein